MWVFTHQQGFLVEKTHVHVHVVDPVVRQGWHLDVTVDAHKGVHQAVDLGFGLDRRVELATGAILIDQKLGGECSAKPIDVEITSGMDQVPGWGGGGVEINAEHICIFNRDLIVQGTGAVVDPFYQLQGVNFFPVNGVCAVIPNPNGIGGDLEEVYPGQGNILAAQLSFNVVGIRGHADHIHFFHRIANDLTDGSLVSPVIHHQVFDLFPLGHGPDREGWRSDKSRRRAAAGGPVIGDQGQLVRGKALWQRIALLGKTETSDEEEKAKDKE